MSSRNFSPQAMFEALGREHRPQCEFARCGESFAVWKAQTLPRVLATAGDFPPAVAPNAELSAQWHHDGLLKQRWILDVGPHISAALLVNYPRDLDLESGQRRPALLCWHGHGEWGKEPVMGNDSSAALRAEIARFNYSYGHQMAQAGFVTFALDWLGAGERNDGQMPNGSRSSLNRDWCNILYLHATMLGLTSLSLNVAHGKAATDFVCGLPGVDASRLGVMGLSGGGTMALWSALFDARLRAIEIICYSGLWAQFGLRDTNYCGLQVAPDLFRLVDLPDAQGLLAPRPLLVDIGAYDSCFDVDQALACYRAVAKIYEAAGVADHLELDLFAGEHGWGANKSVAFFEKHLAAELG